jgi:hypothetical protein
VERAKEKEMTITFTPKELVALRVAVSVSQILTRNLSEANDLQRAQTVAATRKLVQSPLCRELLDVLAEKLTPTPE